MLNLKQFSSRENNYCICSCGYHRRTNKENVSYFYYLLVISFLFLCNNSTSPTERNILQYFALFYLTFRRNRRFWVESSGYKSSSSRLHCATHEIYIWVRYASFHHTKHKHNLFSLVTFGLFLFSSRTF